MAERGFSLERYFRKKLAEESSYTRIAGWWDCKGEKCKAFLTKNPKREHELQTIRGLSLEDMR